MKQPNEIEVEEFLNQFVDCTTVREMQRRLAEAVGDKIPHFLVANGELMRVWLENEVNIELLAANMDRLRHICLGRLKCQLLILTRAQIEMLTMYGPGVVQLSGKWVGRIELYYQGREERKWYGYKKKKLLWAVSPGRERGLNFEHEKLIE